MSGWFFITPQIRNTIFIVLQVLSICMVIETSSIGQGNIYIHLFGWCTFYFAAVNSHTVTRLRRWCSGRRWCRLWLWCTCSLAPPAWLQILCCANLAKKAAVHLIFTNHCRVSFCGTLHHFMSRKLNSSLVLFLHFGNKFHISC